MKYFFFLLVVVLLLSSCEAPQNTKNTDKKFFDLETFLKKQIVFLEKQQPKIIKKIITDGKEEKKEIQLDNWQKELTPFLKADINRPAWQDSFEEKDSTTKEGNWKVYTVNSSRPTVRKLKVLQKDDKVLRMVANIQDNNYLYSSSQMLQLYFSENKLQKYSFKGEQRLFYGDYKEYLIEGKIKR